MLIHESPRHSIIPAPAGIIDNSLPPCRLYTSLCRAVRGSPDPALEVTAGLHNLIRRSRSKRAEKLAQISALERLVEDCGDLRSVRVRGRETRAQRGATLSQDNLVLTGVRRHDTLPARSSRPSQRESEVRQSRVMYKEQIPACAGMTEEFDTSSNPLMSPILTKGGESFNDANSLDGLIKGVSIRIATHGPSDACGLTICQPILYYWSKNER